MFEALELLAVLALSLFVGVQHQRNQASDSGTEPNLVDRVVGESLERVNRSNFSTLFDRIGSAEGMGGELLEAIARVESSLNPNVVGGAGEIGLMQVLPGQRLPALEARGLWSGTEPVGGAVMLYDPEVNITAGAAILKWNLENFGFLRGVAMYNAYGARNDPKQGPFRNQVYVDKVLNQLDLVGGVGERSRLFNRYG